MIKKIKISWEKYEQMVLNLARQIINSGFTYDGIYGIPRGGMVLAVSLSHLLNLPIINKPNHRTLLVDDIADTGKTLLKYEYKHIACLMYTSWTIVMPTFKSNSKTNKDTWIIFPWEVYETEDSKDDTTTN